MTEQDQKIADLKQELKARDQRIKELTGERDQERELVARMREHVQDADGLINSWIEAFAMTMNDKGEWSYVDEARQQYSVLAEKYAALLKDWNRFVPQYNSVVAPRLRNVGRPLDASDAQQIEVLKLRKSGISLRTIADETSLSFRTVRTIIAKSSGTDRATMRRLERIAPDKFADAKERSSKRTRDTLPRRLNVFVRESRDLLKEAKA